MKASEKTGAVIGWKDLEIGCTLTEPGTSKRFKTGDWRSQRPVTDREKCIRCGLCWILCPDMAYIPIEDGFFESNLDYCKGCGTCARECPTDAITMIREE